MFRKKKKSEIEIKVDCEYLFVGEYLVQQYCEYFRDKITAERDCKSCPYYVTMKVNRECYEGEK